MSIARASVLILLVASASAGAQETREEATVRSKDLEQILREIASKLDRPGKKVRIVWLVDNTSFLKKSGQAGRLAELIPRAFSSARGEFSHALCAFEERPRLALPATRNVEGLSRALRVLAEGKPDDRIKNCLLNIHAAAKYAAGGSGEGAVVLFTQENGDNEDRLEPILGFLKRSRVRFFAVAGEAVYSDPYWKSMLGRGGSSADSYRQLKFDLRGPESGFVEFPYGWPLAIVDPTYTVPAGFGTYALTRLARETGGRYYLHNSRGSADSFCRRYGCAVCAGAHKDCDAVYDSTKLDLTAPLFAARTKIMARYTRQGLFLSLVAMWERLHRKGILQGSPALQLKGGRLRPSPEREEQGAFLPIYGREWKSIRAQALRVAADLGKLIPEFAREIRRHGKRADRRVFATAETLDLHVRVLRFNFLQLAWFCEQMDLAPRMGGERHGGFAGSVFTADRALGWGYRNLYFCHGGKALGDIRLLGGRPAEKEAGDLLDRAARIIEKHRGTPWEVLCRRASFVVFYPIVQVARGKTDRERERPKSGSDQTATGTPTRPVRPDKGGGGSGGTATGN